MSSQLESLPQGPDPTMSEAEAEIRLHHDRFDILALTAKGRHRFDAGDHRAAGAFYKVAAKVARERGVADPAAAAAAEHAAEMGKWLDQRFRNHLLAGLDAAGLPREKRPERFQHALEILLGGRERDPVSEEYPQLPNGLFYPGLPYIDFADPADFAWRSALEASFPEMRDEAWALLEDAAQFNPYVRATKERPQGDVHGLLENPNWSTLHLFESGVPVARNVERCPAIYQAVIDHAPLCHIGVRAPSVMLSLLKAGAHIPPHTGMLNVRYIVHLPLVVPPRCSFRVGGRTVEWREGEIILFDDTVEHEARNDGDRDRLVLIFDVWRPELSKDEREAIVRLFQIIDSY